MLARTSALILLAGIGWAEAAEPKARPRLPAPSAGTEQRAAAREPRPDLEPGFKANFRSFDDFLQAESRRPAGLESFRNAPAAPPVAVNAEKTGPAARDPQSSPSRTESGDADILVLPKVEITAERLTKLEAQLGALEAQQAWEESSAEAWENRTVVDAILNPPFLRLGGYSGNARAAVAHRRVEIARWVRILAITLEEAKTPADKTRIQAEINSLNEITRYWE